MTETSFRSSEIIKGATLSANGIYRYHLYRTWDPELLA